jgi:hypothetical protein
MAIKTEISSNKNTRIINKRSKLKVFFSKNMSLFALTLPALIYFVDGVTLKT